MRGITEWKADAVIDDTQKKSDNIAFTAAKIVEAKAKHDHAFKNITGRLEKSIMARRSK